MGAGPVFQSENCRHCDVYLKVSGIGKFPCAWDGLSTAQRDFLSRSGMTAERWCGHRNDETKNFVKNGGAKELPAARSSQGDLL